MRWMAAFLKWLHPGMRVKRWVVLAFAGLLLFLLGLTVMAQTRRTGQGASVRLARAIIAATHAGVRPGIMGVIVTCFGALVFLFAIGRLIHSLTSALGEVGKGGLVEVVYRQRKLAQGKKIVVIGGGTGLSTMLRGLKAYSSNLTAIVTVADDGGSSGKLRKQLNILPPGDIRNCLVALADSETQMTELFQYRFRDSVDPGSAAGGQHIARKSPGESGGDLMPAAASVTTMAPARYGEGLRDHAFGNLLIAAMCAINNGDFELGVRQTSRILKVRGRVLPSTDACVTLRAEMEDGSFIEGEVNIAASPLRIKRMYLSPQDARPMDEVLEAIDQADVIVMGPGSVFTSVIPNLLIRRIPEAIRKSRAKKIYVCNVMTQPGETDGFSAFDHVQAIAKHAQERVFDYVMVNTGRPDTERIEKYRSTGSLLVEADTDRIKAAGYRTITGNFINQTDVVRHEATRLAEAIIRLVA